MGYQEDPPEPDPIVIQLMRDDGAVERCELHDVLWDNGSEHVGDCHDAAAATWEVIDLPAFAEIRRRYKTQEELRLAMSLVIESIGDGCNDCQKWNDD
jgi:hypothetical protein